MNSKPGLAILLEFGFHEIKKYLYSGFAEKLSQHFDIIWLALDKGSPEFDKYFNSTGFPLVYFSKDDLVVQDSITETRNQVVRRQWMNVKNLGAFHNYNRIDARTLKSYLLGNGLLRSVYEKKALKLVKKLYFNTKLAETFDKYHIDNILGTGYASPFAKAVFTSAGRQKIKTWYLVNSWKDLYTNSFVPFEFLDGIFVWSEQMKSDYRYHMPYLRSERIHVTGNPTFDILKTSKPTHPRSYLAQKYGISEMADWLLYSMMPPGLVNDEIETVTIIARELLKAYPPEEKTIILRRNPNHSTNDFKDRKLPDNLIIADHYCTYDKENDMIIQSAQGEQEWLDMVHYCTLNISVPSTVTLEFLTLNKPVINIGFGPDGKPDERIKQHFESGFYKPMFEDKRVKKVISIDELNKALLDASNLITAKASGTFIDESAAVKILHVLLNEN